MFSTLRKSQLSAAPAVILTAGLLLTGCGAGGSTASSQPTSASSATGPTSGGSSASDPPASGASIAITIQGDTVTPNGKRIESSLGQPLTLTVRSDRAGELHVHSTPEQELKYSKGTTTLHVTIDKPGIVDIEDHIADVVVVQLEVS
jgi:hypothetical protein